MVLAQGTKDISLKPQRPESAGKSCTFDQELLQNGLLGFGLGCSLRSLCSPSPSTSHSHPWAPRPSPSRSPSVRAHLPPRHWLLFGLGNKKVEGDSLRENHFHSLSGLNYGSENVNAFL